MDASAQGGSGGGGGIASDAMTVPEVKSDAAPTVTVYDLQKDWSDTQNPFGAWTIMIGPKEASSGAKQHRQVRSELERFPGAVRVLDVRQRQWAHPVLLKVSVSGFEADQAQKGDLIVHTQDEQGGPGLGQARMYGPHHRPEPSTSTARSGSGGFR